MTTNLTEDEKANGKIIKVSEEITCDESVDSQIQSEIKRFKCTTDLINKLEIELDDTRLSFRNLLNESSLSINNFTKKLESCIKISKPNHEASKLAKKLISSNQKTNDQLFQSRYKESEKMAEQLNQEVKKCISKTSLSTRRNLLQLNNLANQHQLQLLPYFEMKAQFNQMLDEQREKVPHWEKIGSKFLLVDNEYSVEEINKDEFNYLNPDNSSAEINHVSNSTVSYLKSDSLSSENIYLEHLFSEDAYMALPPNLKVTPGLANCIPNYLNKNTLNLLSDF